MDKFDKLKALLKSWGKVAIAFSGGVDSTFLLKAAIDTLGRENVFAMTLRSSVNPSYEMDEAEELLQQLKANYLMMNVNVFEVEGFGANPPDRCYICKKAIFEQVIAEAAKRGFDIVVDGTNADDEGDYRPGMQALAELKVRSPLQECGITKAEVRDWSKALGLHTWNKPSLACLASRIPYHEEITEEKLRMVEAAERYIGRLGFTQYRVRCHGNLARIELLPSEMKHFCAQDLFLQTENELKKIGFKYVTLDLKGYRTGSMNETLSL